MRRYLKISNMFVAFGVLLPLATFAQIKTTVTGPTEGFSNFIVAPAISPTSVKTEPTQTVTTDAAKEFLRTQTTKVLSPTSPTLVAPTGGQVAPTKTIQPSTGASVPTQKTVTSVPLPQAPALKKTAVNASAPVIQQFAAAQVMYQWYNLSALEDAAEKSTDGLAEAFPLQLAQLPYTPTLNVRAESGGGVVFQVVGGGIYDVRGVVVGANNETLDEFRESEFTVFLSAYKDKDPRAVAVIITYLPAESTLTFFEEEAGGGLKLPPPTGVAPIPPTALTKPVAVAPVTPVVPEAGAPGEGDIVRKIPRGEEPEEIIFEEGEISTPEGEGIPEDGLELPTGEEPIEEPGIVERFGDFVSDLFGIKPEVEEEVIEEMVEAEIEFEDEDGKDADFFGLGDESEEGAEFFEGEPDKSFAFDGELKAPDFDFTDFGVAPDEFVGAETVGELDFGFVSRDLELESEEEFVEAEDEIFGAAGEDEFVLGESVEDSFAEESLVEKEVGDLDFSFGDLALAPEEEFVSEEEEFAFGDADAFFEELFTPDLSATVVVPDYGAVGDDIVVTVLLEGIFDAGEKPLVASLVFAPVAGGSGLEFSEPIDAADTVTFTIPRAVLSVLGAEMRVLLKTTATLNGFLVVSTDVLGVARNE